jgi:probable HAF family extracellular repeat protein
MNRLFSALALAGLVSAFPGLATAQPEVATRPFLAVTQLSPTSTFTGVSPLGVSDSGVVAGLQSTSVGTSQAAIWDGKAWHLLGSGEADAINHNNYVVGFRTVGDSQHATEWTPQGTPTDLGLLPNGRSSQALAVNDRAWVAGYGQTGSSTHAFVWQASQGMRDLGSLGSGNSYGFGLNNKGQVVGSANGVAVMWDTQRKIHDLGAGAGSVAYGINGSGDVVGNAANFAFVWTPGRGVRHLAMAPNATSATAASINERGLIVGSETLTDTSGNLSSHAALWHKDTLIDLNSLVDPSSGWLLTTATAINNHNQVVGTGLLNGQPRGFLLDLGKAAGLRSIADSD